MSKTQTRGAEVETFVLEHVEQHPTDIVRAASEHFGVSRQAIHRHLARLVEQGKLKATGSTKSRRYELALLVDETFTVEVTPALEEHQVWGERVAPYLLDLPKNVREICSYGFTEMLNNVIDHSGSTEAVIAVKRSPARVTLAILDRGVGIFRKIASELGLDDERYAVLELSKGKLTTDPKRHTGEGIFFTSRMFDQFSINAGPIRLICFDGKSWLVDSRDYAEFDSMDGTGVLMEIDLRSKRTCQEVFQRFASEEDDFGFTRTHVPVTLARHGEENLVSRSQAKRLLARFDRFKEVLLDFQDVHSIGQAFADEVFRVFSNEHPEIRLRWINATPEVERMIKRALHAKQEQASS